MLTTIDLTDFEPAELGLPGKFERFRDPQLELVEWVTGSSKRFMAAGLPTGSGKSLSAMALARATGLRTAILTVTRGLEAQYLSDFKSTGLVNIHGKSNYPCGEINTSCRFGEMEGCRLTGDLGCTYECQRSAAKHSRIVLTNYAYWIRINELTRGLQYTPTEEAVSGGPNPFELLILDEAGKADVELANSLKCSIRESWLRTVGVKGTGHGDDIGYWVQFWARNSVWIDEELKTAVRDFHRQHTKKLRDRVYELTELVESLERVSRMTDDHWVCEVQLGTSSGRRWDFECAWPGSWAESKMFIGIPKVVLIGATLKPGNLNTLGIRKADREFREWPRVFPAHHTPVYHIPTVRMNAKVSDTQLRVWVDRIDEIIESREDRKGIIHTVSYERQQYLARHSRFQQHFVLNTNAPDSESAAETVGRFKAMSAPAILVSPSFSTGWDFPRRQCEWQIIAKLAFPGKSKVLDARKKRDPLYIDKMVMQDLVQACGRGTRDELDRCEVFIVDDNVSWFLWRNKALKPGWFEIRDLQQVPVPGRRCDPIDAAGIGVSRVG